MKLMPVKLLIFLFIPLLLAASYGYLLSTFAASGNYTYLTASIITIILFLSLFLIQVLLITHWSQGLPTILAELILLTPFFYIAGGGKNFYWLAAAIILALILLFSGYYHGRKELRNMISIDFSGMRKIVLRRAMLGVILFSTIAYISLVDVKNLKISEKLIQYLSKPIELSGKIFFNDFSLAMRVGDFFDNLADKNISGKLKDLPPAAQQEIKNQIKNDLLKRVSEIAKMKINTQWTLSRAIVEISNFQIRSIPPQRHNIVLLVIGLTIFLFTAGFSLILSWIIGLLSWLIYRLLLKAGFIKIMYQSKTVESIIL